MTNSQVEIDQAVHRLAFEYLGSVQPKPITRAMLEKYMSVPIDKWTRPPSLAGIYLRLLKAAQNRGMMPQVIGASIGGVERLGVVLCNFDPRTVLEKYTGGSKQVWKEIKVKLKPKGQLRSTAKSLWPSYCESILSSAKFLSQFGSHQEFYEWIGWFYADPRARPALPMLIDREIHGVGFALACDFLKEMGYSNYPKPDVQLRRIFVGLGLCPAKARDYELYKAIIRVAAHVQETPFAVDKLFWLIGSGKLDQDKLNIGRHGDRFVRYAHRKMKLRPL